MYDEEGREEYLWEIRQRGGGAARFNRTFMELKLFKVDFKVKRRFVLIVPLWN